MGEFAIKIWTKFINEFPAAIWETLYMCLFSTTLAFILGLIMAILLVITSKNGLKTNAKVYNMLDIFTNTLRSFPFII